MLTDKQNTHLLKAVELLHEADRQMQLGFKGLNSDEDGEECYAIHNAIECAADDILDVIQQHNEADIEA